MSSNADYSTALATMRSANNDMRELIRNLQDLLTSDDAVTFTIGGKELVVSSLKAAIRYLKEGNYTTLTIGDQSTGGTRVVLSVDGNGNLVVKGPDGSIVPVMCNGVYGSTVDSCDVQSVTATDCTIGHVNGKVSVTGGKVSVDLLDTEELNVGQLECDSVDIQNLKIKGNLASMGVLAYGTRKLTVANARDVFRMGNIPVDNANKAIASAINVAGVWNVDDEFGGASILGYPKATNALDNLPGMISILGNNKYSSFSNLKPTNIYVSPNSMSASIKLARMDTYDFPALILWPRGYIQPVNTSASGSSTMSLILRMFEVSDIGKDIYIRTGAEDWIMYRTLTYRDNGTCSFGVPYALPKYSCIRFIANVRELDGATMSVLEIA